MPLGLDKNFYNIVLPLVLVESVLFAYAFTSDLRTCQVVLGLLGLWWCLAAIWVEIKLDRKYPGFNYEKTVVTESTYRPFCDFAPWAACSKVLMSPPGRFLKYFGVARPAHKILRLIDVPNPVLGVAFFGAHLFYPALLILPVPFLPQLFLAACVFVGGMTVWLAYNLAFVLRDFCVVCVSMYVANFALIPMMYGLQWRDEVSWLGAVDVRFAAAFGLLDAVMGAAVLGLWLSGGGLQLWLSGEHPHGDAYAKMEDGARIDSPAHAA